MTDIKILNFGSLNIDKIYEVDEIGKVGETISSSSFEETIGGKGLNQTVAIHRAGGDVYHAGLVGDRDSQILLDFIMDNKINSLIEKIEGSSGHAIIQIDQHGNNSIMVAGGANHKISQSYIDKVMGNFSKGDYLIIQNEINANPKIIEKAKEKGMVIFLNPSPIDDRINDIDLNLIDYILINENEGEKLTGRFLAKEIISYFKTNYPNLGVVLTLGADGGVYAKGKVYTDFKAYPVEVVDSTAAGDTFLGYFVANLAGDKSIEENLDLASFAASMTCKKKGAARAIPKRDEVIEAKKKERRTK